ncbi:MAG: hypothetical protein GX636_08275, partial [Actinomycetales bacterium]|nr:hypothetical protein [Actinomycetales bacterium]
TSRVRMLWTDDAGADGVGLRTAVTSGEDCVSGGGLLGSVGDLEPIIEPLLGSLGTLDLPVPVTTESVIGALPAL